MVFRGKGRIDYMNNFSSQLIRKLGNHFIHLPQGAISPWTKKPAVESNQNRTDGKTGKGQQRRKGKKKKANKPSARKRKDDVEARQLGASSTTDLREKFNRCKKSTKGNYKF